MTEKEIREIETDSKTERVSERDSETEEERREIKKEKKRQTVSGFCSDRLSNNTFNSLYSHGSCFLGKP